MAASGACLGIRCRPHRCARGVNSMGAVWYRIDDWVCFLTSVANSLGVVLLVCNFNHGICHAAHRKGMRTVFRSAVTASPSGESGGLVNWQLPNQSLEPTRVGKPPLAAQLQR